MPKKLFLDLETSNFDYSHVFSSLWKWQGQILPNLTIWTQKWHISGKIQVLKKQLFWHNGTWILPEICRFWVQNVKLGKIWPHHYNRLEKTYLELKFHIPNLKNKNLVIQSGFQKIWKIALLLTTFRCINPFYYCNWLSLTVFNFSPKVFWNDGCKQIICP